MALEHFNNMPGKSGRSPYELLFHRRGNIGMPMVQSQRQPLTTEDLQVANDKIQKYREKMIENFNKGMRELSELTVGAKVIVREYRTGYPRSWSVRAEVVEIRPSKGRQSYFVLTEHGHRLLRNQKFLWVDMTKQGQQPAPVRPPDQPTEEVTQASPPMKRVTRADSRAKDATSAPPMTFANMEEAGGECRTPTRSGAGTLALHHPDSTYGVDDNRIAPR